MSVAVAMRIYFAHPSPPLRNFLSSYEIREGGLANTIKPLRPCISSKGEPESDGAEWESSKCKNKKKVVFADSKGLSLTAIHVFSEFEENSELGLQFAIADLADSPAGLKLHDERNLMLGFSQPSADYLEFRNRLQRNFVCLENCTLQEKSIAGTVKVKNLSFEKTVQVRITFDSWKSYTDVDCTYMNNVYGGSDSDTFSFVIDLPAFVPPHEHIEFCISFTCKDGVHWDNNNGCNYVIVPSEWKTNGIQAPVSPVHEMPSYKKRGKSEQVDFDRYGSPRTSSGLFPEWQSWDRIENTAPYW
ncbi:protein phosphatase 1 regulatory subunit 3C [Protopterus annectens]|uniref:protein phosphatase 1 regulatory subunit 3C n=1 Tax=Protopterus annectens TaxID=7888 RepID=UPI001CFC03C8|nr:protein phosphatase 1 regulatory subunit 3C [Protopterus annectens]XP_043912587.1 protein phosphatase 1 regulatory subunit 3C [Protopterus annectens]XP_043912588.1 protein phosphatase 1 regulatory subunit 3C [Protopterus annectens]